MLKFYAYAVGALFHFPSGHDGLADSYNGVVAHNDHFVIRDNLVVCLFDSRRKYGVGLQIKIDVYDMDSKILKDFTAFKVQSEKP